MTTYELPQEPPIGESVQDVHGRTWKHEGVNRWCLKDADYADDPETRSWHRVLLSAPLTLIEPDPWPTAPLIVAQREGKFGAPCYALWMRDGTVNYASIASKTVLWAQPDMHTLTNVVPVTVVPTAALPVLWSALERWLNHANRILPSEETQLLVGAVVALREQIDALGVDL